MITELPLIDSQLSQVTWAAWFVLNDLILPTRARASFDRAALSLSAAVDGMGVALESTRLAERELARGDLVELGASVFRRLERETHFLAIRAVAALSPEAGQNPERRHARPCRARRASARRHGCARRCASGTGPGSGLAGPVFPAAYRPFQAVKHPFFAAEAVGADRSDQGQPKPPVFFFSPSVEIAGGHHYH